MDLRTLPGVAVAIEMLLLGVQDGKLTYRRGQRVLADGEHPDAVARDLAGFGPGPAGDDPGATGSVLHSTSWRFTPGCIVLTYAALPDPHPATATAFEAPAEPARGAGPLTPSPEHLAQADVLAHACRHLAFLHHTDPVVAMAAARQPALWALLAAYRPEVAGQQTAR